MRFCLHNQRPSVKFPTLRSDVRPRTSGVDSVDELKRLIRRNMWEIGVSVCCEVRRE